MVSTWSGFRVIESPYLEEDGPPQEVRRSWRARLFSRPWRPWVATYTVVPKVPSTRIVRINENTLVMHPETLKLARTLAMTHEQIAALVPQEGRSR